MVFEPVLNRCKCGKSIEDGRKLFTDYSMDHIEVVTVPHCFSLRSGPFTELADI
jgi:hypothetical protein